MERSTIKVKEASTLKNDQKLRTNFIRAYLGKKVGNIQEEAPLINNSLLRKGNQMINQE